MIEVSVALREGGGCPPCYGLVNISVALQWGGEWGEITPKTEKSRDCFFLTLLYLNHSILTFIAPRNDSGGVLVFECKWVTMERERNGLLWCVNAGLLW